MPASVGAAKPIVLKIMRPEVDPKVTPTKAVDKEFSCVLFIAKNIVPVQLTTTEQGIMSFHFVISEIDEIETSLLSGKELLVSWERVTYANNIWATGLELNKEIKSKYYANKSRRN